MKAVMIVCLLALLAVARGQTTASVSGTVDWSASSTWSGGLVPVAVGSTAAVTVNADATINLNVAQALLSFSLSKANLVIASADFLAATAVMNGGTITMTGTSKVQTVTTFTCNSGQPNNTIHGGVLALDAVTASAKVSAGAMLNVEGAEIKSNAATVITVGADTGHAAALWFRTTAESKINQGVYDIKAMGSFVVGAQASARVTAAAKAQGTGKFIVRAGGSIHLDAALTCSAEAQIDGAVNFAAGIASTFKNVAFSTSASAKFSASASGFAPIMVSGNAQLSGSVNVDLGAFVTTTKVLIMKVAGTRTGVFASVTVTKQALTSPTSRRLLAEGSGSVTYVEGEVYYDPSASAALGRAPSALIALLAVAVACLLRN